jgi:hypothetical protein
LAKTGASGVFPICELPQSGGIVFFACSRKHSELPSVQTEIPDRYARGLLGPRLHSQVTDPVKRNVPSALYVIAATEVGWISSAGASVLHPIAEYQLPGFKVFDRGGATLQHKMVTMS